MPNIKHNLPLLSVLLNNFNLSRAECTELDNYYVLHWEGAYLYRAMNSYGIITHQDVSYICNFPSIHRAALLTTPSVQISLRVPKEHTGLPPIAVIRIK